MCYCPIDTGLSFSQANKLMRDLKPGHLVVAESYVQPPSNLSHKTDMVVDYVRQLTFITDQKLFSYMHEILV